MLVISACLCGVNCKYNGGHNASAALLERLQASGIAYRLVCPEQLGGLPTPRIPAERQGEAVITQKGKDVTAEFSHGAIAATQVALQAGAKWALLKEGSPSCGVNVIYDGTFTGTKCAGQGVTTERLLRVGIRCFSETQLEALFDEMADQMR